MLLFFLNNFLFGMFFSFLLPFIFTRLFILRFYLSLLKFHLFSKTLYSFIISFSLSLIVVFYLPCSLCRFFLFICIFLLFRACFFSSSCFSFSFFTFSFYFPWFSFPSHESFPFQMPFNSLPVSLFTFIPSSKLINIYLPVSVSLATPNHFLPCLL